MRVNRYLAQCGVASRRKSEVLVLEGKVEINGKKCLDLSTLVGAGDRVKVDGHFVQAKSEKEYLAFHKPPGYLCTRKDPGGRPLIYELLPPDATALRYVGRLDFESRGLLILCSDGKLVHRLTHPSFGVERSYSVEVDRALDDSHYKKLKTGVSLGDGERGRVLSVQGTDRYLTLVLGEGKKREIRRMMRSLGREVLDLKRVSYGTVDVDGIPEGSYRALGEHEIGGLYEMVGLDRPVSVGNSY